MPGTIGGLSKSYVSSIEFLDQREILNKVLDITNEELSFIDVMELTGRSKPTSVPEYHHFVNEELYVLATVTAVTGSGTTGIAAGLEGFEFVGMEREAEYREIAEARLRWWGEQEGETLEILQRAGLAEKERAKAEAAGQTSLFEEAA